MFHVLVLGGLALVGCGGAVGVDKGTTDAAPSDATSTDEFFPTETANFAYDASGSPADAPSAALEDGSSFPSELPPVPPPALDAQDAGAATGDASEYADARLPDAGICVPCEAPK
jgi:hypothetical protein